MKKNKNITISTDKIGMNEIDKRKNNLRKLKITMFILDVFCLPIIIYEIISKSFNIPSFVIFVLCNIIVFVSKIK